MTWRAEPNSHLGWTTCAGCNTPVLSIGRWADEARCLGCARTDQGINWPSGQSHGAWHPTVGDTLVRRSAGSPPVVTESAWWWRCIWCNARGRASSGDHVAGLIRIHNAHACPATADNRYEYRLRCARRADLSARYPEDAPPWSEKKRRPA